MSVKCKNCWYAEWQRTEKGNVRRTLVGRCTYVPPPGPVMLHTPQMEQARRFGGRDTRPVVVWNYEGRCDLFKPIDKEAGNG